MDIQPQNQQPISDDQELAKVLAGVSQQADDAQAQGTSPMADLPEPIMPGATDMPELPELPEMPPIEPPVAAEPEQPAMPDFTPQAPAAAATPGDLDSIKQEALGELRPLVDKLDVSPEEKFDTYLLLLRSTDDQSLIAPGFAAARAIADEARRAQALLDIIKEIDYLSGRQAA